MTRISFPQFDAQAIYEWWLKIQQISPEEESCCVCPHIAKRLETFIGKSEVKRLQKLVKKYPYGK